MSRNVEERSVVEGVDVKERGGVCGKGEKRNPVVIIVEKKPLIICHGGLNMESLWT